MGARWHRLIVRTSTATQMSGLHMCGHRYPPLSVQSIEKQKQLVVIGFD